MITKFLIALPIVFLMSCTVDMSEDINRLDQPEVENRIETFDIPDEIVEELSFTQKERISYYLEDGATFLGHESIENSTLNPNDEDSSMQFSLTLFEQNDGNLATFPSFKFAGSTSLDNDSFAFTHSQNPSNPLVTVANVGSVDLFTSGKLSEDRTVAYETSQSQAGFTGISFHLSNVTSRSLDQPEGIGFIEFSLHDDFDEENFEFILAYAQDDSFFNNADDYDAVYEQEELIAFRPSQDNVHTISEVIRFNDLSVPE